MNYIWILLVVTPDAHDSPNDITLHLSLMHAMAKAEKDDAEMYLPKETHKPIKWLEDDKGHRFIGDGVGYEYIISLHELPEVTDALL